MVMVTDTHGPASESLDFLDDHEDEHDDQMEEME